MKRLKLVARVVTYDKVTNKILLARNKNETFWYAPGGGWEFDHENILECGKREVFEETGMHVDLIKFLYMQEFHGSEDVVRLEVFWLAKPSYSQELNSDHIDLDPVGVVDEARWFSAEELKDLKVFPQRLKDTFWENINSLETSEDPFIGIV